MPQAIDLALARLAAAEAEDTAVPGPGAGPVQGRLLPGGSGRVPVDMRTALLALRSETFRLWDGSAQD
jgi:hypothetical protein